MLAARLSQMVGVLSVLLLVLLSSITHPPSSNLILAAVTPNTRSQEHQYDDQMQAPPPASRIQQQHNIVHDQQSPQHTSSSTDSTRLITKQNQAMDVHKDSALPATSYTRKRDDNNVGGEFKSEQRLSDGNKVILSKEFWIEQHKFPSLSSETRRSDTRRLEYSKSVIDQTGNSYGYTVDKNKNNKNNNNNNNDKAGPSGFPNKDVNYKELNDVETHVRDSVLRVAAPLSIASPPDSKTDGLFKNQDQPGDAVGSFPQTPTEAGFVYDNANNYSNYSSENISGDNRKININVDSFISDRDSLVREKRTANRNPNSNNENDNDTGGIVSSNDNNDNNNNNKKSRKRKKDNDTSGKESNKDKSKVSSEGFKMEQTILAKAKEKSKELSKNGRLVGFWEKTNKENAKKSANADKVSPSFYAEDIQVGCRELRARRYITDGFCTSERAIKEVVCAGHCLPIKDMPWYAEFVKTISRNKLLDWQCVEDFVRKKRVKLVCRNLEYRYYRIKVVKSCKCKKMTNRHNRTRRNRKKKRRRRRGKKNRQSNKES